MFWKNKSQNDGVKEYIDVVKRLALCEARLDGLELENKMLRDKVLRKIQMQSEKEEEQKQPKNLNSLNPFAL